MKKRITYPRELPSYNESLMQSSNPTSCFETGKPILNKPGLKKRVIGKRPESMRWPFLLPKSQKGRKREQRNCYVKNQKLNSYRQKFPIQYRLPIALSRTINLLLRKIHLKQRTKSFLKFRLDLFPMENLLRHSNQGIKSCLCSGQLINIPMQKSMLSILSEISPIIMMLLCLKTSCYWKERKVHFWPPIKTG